MYYCAENTRYEDIPVKSDYRGIKLTWRDVSLSVSLLICGFLYFDLISFPGLGAGVTAFSAVLCTVTWVYLKSRGYRQDKRSLVCMVLLIVSSVQFLIFDSTVEKSLNFIFVSLLFVYWTALFTKRTLDDTLSVYAAGDLIRQFFVTPFSNFGMCPGIILTAVSGKSIWKKILTAVLAVAAAAPLLFIVVGLLMSADGSFARMITSAGKFFSEDMIEMLLKFILGIPVAFYLCGLIFGDAAGLNGRSSRESFEKCAGKVALIPGTAVCSVLFVLCVIYAVFISLQAYELFGLAWGNVHADATYSSYARTGFFQLCTVAVINLAVAVSGYVFARDRKGMSLRIGVLALSAVTLVLSAVDLGKMALYVHYYGLTLLRVYASAFMAFLAFVFIIISLRQIRRFNSVRVFIILSAAFFILFSFAGISGRIAEYDIQRYEAGTLKMMDTAAMIQLSDEAVPYLYEEYKKTDDKKMKDRIYYAAVENHQEKADSGWRNFNAAQKKADGIRKKIVRKYRQGR